MSFQIQCLSEDRAHQQAWAQKNGALTALEAAEEYCMWYVQCPLTPITNPWLLVRVTSDGEESECFCARLRLPKAGDMQVTIVLDILPAHEAVGDGGLWQTSKPLPPGLGEALGWALPHDPRMKLALDSHARTSHE